MDLSGWKAALIGALAIGALSTFGDFFWANWITQHRQVYGITHGAVLFFSLGLVLGIVAHRPMFGGVAGVMIGAAAAGSFYVLRPAIGRWTMVVCYVGAWVGLSALHAWLSGKSFGASAILRGAVAAALSGAAFYLASGVWRPFSPQGWDYLTHFAAWTLAYFPGFAALLVGRAAAAAVLGRVPG